MELLTKSSANPLLEDYKGRTLLDMIYAYSPSYVETFQNLLETLQLNGSKPSSEAATDNGAGANGDDRIIQGVNAEEIRTLYEQEESKVSNNGGLKSESE